MAGRGVGVGAGTVLSARCDLAVVGAGIVGLAVARELQRRHPGWRIRVLERERRVAAHQSSHNSGVVHSGIYYVPGSLKARLCAEGLRETYAICERHGLAQARRGKLIVATEPAELAALDELERRGRANGVPGLRRVDGEQARAIEPEVRALAALHSPGTGVADFAAVARALADELLDCGAEIALGCEVLGVRAGPRALRLEHGGGAVTEARGAIFCAGAWADRLAVRAGAAPDPRIVPFRGAYLRLRPEAAPLVRGLIYPVPDPRLPFLGVHLTRGVDEQVLIGPTALLAPARDAYRLGRVRARDLGSTLAWPGTWRLMARFWRTGLVELSRAAWKGAVVGAARRLLPALRPADALSSFAGVRAQALGRDGRLLDDFAFSATERALHVRNAPSPGGTSALAIAGLIADRAERELGLGR